MEKYLLITWINGNPLIDVNGPIPNKNLWIIGNHYQKLKELNKELLDGKN
jgi:hypothetical protein